MCCIAFAFRRAQHPPRDIHTAHFNHQRSMRCTIRMLTAQNRPRRSGTPSVALSRLGKGGRLWPFFHYKVKEVFFLNLNLIYGFKRNYSYQFSLAHKNRDVECVMPEGCSRCMLGRDGPTPARAARGARKSKSHRVLAAHATTAPRQKLSLALYLT